MFKDFLFKTRIDCSLQIVESVFTYKSDSLHVHNNFDLESNIHCHYVRYWYVLFDLCSIINIAQD